MPEKPALERPTLFIIAHTHWDREWYATFQQFRMRLVHVMDALLDLLERDPSFTHFNLDAQTVVLQDYLEIRPEEAVRLRKLVRDRRLGIGPWYVLPDEFLVSVIVVLDSNDGIDCALVQIRRDPFLDGLHAAGIQIAVDPSVCKHNEIPDEVWPESCDVQVSPERKHLWLVLKTVFDENCVRVIYFCQDPNCHK